MNELTEINAKLDRILALLEKKKVVRKEKVDPYDASFERWWGLYPRKVGKKACLRIWCSHNLTAIAGRLIVDIKNRVENDSLWLQNIGIPHPSTFLNGERWNDDITPVQKQSVTIPRNDDEATRWGNDHGLPAKKGESMWNYRQRLQASL